MCFHHHFWSILWEVLSEPVFPSRASALVCFSLGASSVVPVRIEDRTCGCQLCGEEAVSAGGEGGLEGDEDCDVWVRLLVTLTGPCRT